MVGNRQYTQYISYYRSIDRLWSHGGGRAAFEMGSIYYLFGISFFFPLNFQLFIILSPIRQTDQHKEMTTLLLIDVQKDFHPGGSLAIPTADKDANHIASFIRKHSSSISRIVLTMDSHHRLHIAHPVFWKNAQGEHPSPFTIISMKDIQDGKWIPRTDIKQPVKSSRSGPLIDNTIFSKEGDIPETMYDDCGNLDMVQYCIEYTRRLEEKGKFQLCIWPEHCLIGSEGHNVVPNVMDAVNYWCNESGGSVEWINKGQNLLTEMYSALCSEVPISKKTSFDHDLFESLKTGTDKLIMCGQALSHCVNYTVRDIVQQWPTDEIDKLVIFEDCASSVPGFEAAGGQFLKDMKDTGVGIATSETYQP